MVLLKRGTDLYFGRNKSREHKLQASITGNHCKMLGIGQEEPRCREEPCKDGLLQETNSKAAETPFLLRDRLPALLRRKKQLFWYNTAPAKGNILCSDF